MVRASLMCTLLVACASAPQPRPPIRSADAIVVLGNRPPVDAAGRVRPELRRRVETGVRLFHAGLAPRLILTGGPAPGGAVEAHVMRRLSVALGVPAERIVVEERSQSTAENAAFTLRMLCGRDALCMPSLIVVSSPLHLRRARRLFECAGARVQTAPTPVPTARIYRRRFRAYESVAAIAAGASDPCRRIRALRAAGRSTPAR